MTKPYWDDETTGPISRVLSDADDAIQQGRFTVNSTVFTSGTSTVVAPMVENYETRIKQLKSGPAAPEEPPIPPIITRSYWSCLLSNIDQPDNQYIAKEVLFWGLYQRKYSEVDVIVDGFEGTHETTARFKNKYGFHQFPAIIVGTDQFYSESVCIERGAFQEDFLGERYENLRGAMATIHWEILENGTLMYVKKKELVKKIIGALEKTDEVGKRLLEYIKIVLP